MTVSTLRDRLQALSGPKSASAEELLFAFLAHAEERGLSLYPAQEAAVLELLEGKNVILNTPTGSGKSLVASLLHFQAMAQGRRSAYTCPIKALVNEKWLALCREFGPENVGLSTGDASVNRDAPILCCTAEILAHMALAEGADCAIRDVVVDEFHYYSDRDRGVAWQIPLLALERTRFLLMSATLGETAFFEKALTDLNGYPSVTVRSSDRPVPLTFLYSETALAETVLRLARGGNAPVYVVHFTQAEAARNAQSFTSLELATKEEKTALAEALEGFRFSSPYGPDLKRWLRQGIGLHHAGLLPKYRILTEKLAQKGLLKLICGTDTLGVGVNVPIRTVLFTQLCKYDGEKTAILSARDFHQIAGRAGRKGFDDQGLVVAQAPEHVIENLKLAAKNAQTGRKFVKRQPPEKGYMPWDAGTFNRLVEARPERLVSRFKVGHGILLKVLARPENGCRAMRNLLRKSHDGEKEKKAHRDRAFQLFRSLVERGIVEVTPAEPGRAGKLRVNMDLQTEFSMDQALSLYLLDTLPLLDADHPDHALDLLSLVEAILENPEAVLRRQLDKLKTERLQELKAQGVEYDRRMQELEEMEYPKPLREFIYSSFNAFAEKHPWVGDENIRPKSIAREMLEGYFTFSGYVKRYGLERSEGLLLRHLDAVYKVLVKTVPAAKKTEAVREMEAFFGEMVRRVDSSLLEEWERLQNPDFVPDLAAEPLPPGAEGSGAARDITADPKAFTALVRARIFSFLSAAARQDFAGALEVFSEGLDDEALNALKEEGADGQENLPGGAPSPWTEDTLREAFSEYRREHGPFRLDPEGRSLQHTDIEKEREPGGGNSGGTEDGRASRWTVRQTLVDPAGRNDWRLVLRVDLKASRRIGIAVLRLLRIGPAEGPDLDE